jgi:putative Ca2+/H+ antiporter (TMEM165/GDT1 family)
MEAFLTALGTVFLAELGDKTQLGVLLLTERWRRPFTTLAAASLALCASAALAATLGGLLGNVLGGPVLGLIAGLVFLIYGAFALREAIRPVDEDLDEVEVKPGRIFAMIFVAIFVAELGDKTQIATALLASRGEPIPTALGSGLALVLDTAIAVILGMALTRLPAKARHIARLLGALGFLAVGAWQIVSALSDLL